LNFYVQNIFSENGILRDKKSGQLAAARILVTLLRVDFVI